MSAPFCWYELMTTDTAAAGAFYTQVVGWTTRDMPGAAMPYTIFQAGETGVAGMMALPAEAAEHGARTGWIGYVAVEDADAALGRALELGGKSIRPVEEISGVGRFAILADPGGAVIAILQPVDPNVSVPSGPGPGFAAWRELMAHDLDDAWAFYSGLFGWTKGPGHDMGPMGVYQLFGTGGEPVGGMMTKPPQVPAPFWAYYFTVDGVQAGAERIRAAGGTVVNGPMQVPGGDWIVQALDPQGGFFCLFSRAA